MNFTSWPRSKEITIEVNQAANFLQVLFCLLALLSLDNRSNYFLKLRRQLKVCIFYREMHGDDLVEPKLTLEVLVKPHAFELLEKQDNELEQLLGVVIRHGQVALALQTAHVALH